MDEKNKETVVLGVINRGVNKFDQIAREAKIEHIANVSTTLLAVAAILHG